MQIHAHHLGYKTRGEHNGRFFFISGHFCASQDKVVSKSVAFLTAFRETKPWKNKKSNFRVFSKFW